MIDLLLDPDKALDGINGSSATNANIQPYITVFMWKRTA